MTNDPVEGFVEGWTAPGYEGLRTAFASNLRVGDDLGAALAIYRHGDCVVDLTGGLAEPDGARYPHDALQLVFSATKGLLGLCLAALVEDGAIDVDQPIAAYWPEFGRNGKRDITVRQAASHQAGLPAFEEHMPLHVLGDWERCCNLLADQSPLWQPGSAHGYHAITVGHLVGEVIRRAVGMSVGRVLRERFAAPLELETWIGLPSGLVSRVVPLVEPVPANGVGDVLLRAEATAGTITNLAFSNPPITAASFNDPAVFECEIPSVNAITDARSLARLYSTVVDGPLRALRPTTVDAMRAVQVDGRDLVLVDQPTRFGTCFMLAAPREPMLGPGSFGHNGRGGSLAFAHPESGVAYAFVVNRIVNDPAPDRRNVRLLAALGEALATQRLAGCSKSTTQSASARCLGDTIQHLTLVARSGLAITKSEQLVWAGGELLSPSSLAHALQRRGDPCDELDINPDWVDGYLYVHHPTGLTAAPVIPGQLGIDGYSPVERVLAETIGKDLGQSANSLIPRLAARSSVAGLRELYESDEARP